MVHRFEQDPASSTSRAIHGDRWSMTDQLLAELFDVLQIANWQRAGKKHNPKPKRLPRPWEKSKARRLGAKPIPISQFNDWWESKRKRR